MRKILAWFGLGCLGYCGYAVGMQELNQSYDNWAFDRQHSGQTDVSVTEYLKERTPLDFLLKSSPASEPPPKGPEPNEVLGRIEISRLHLSDIVREGVDAQTLSVAVGHIPSTALPGHLGNFALAAHRDTLFRALKDIRRDDVITFESGTHTYTYRVEDTRVVKPSDVSVLNPDGYETLTLITCYPFYYVGSAPERFIVRARAVHPQQPSTV